MLVDADERLMLLLLMLLLVAGRLLLLLLVAGGNLCAILGRQKHLNALITMCS